MTSNTHDTDTMSVEEANAKHGGSPTASLAALAQVRKVPEGKGAKPSPKKALGLGIKRVTKPSERAEQDAESAQTLDTFKLMRGDFDNDSERTEEVEANSIPRAVVDTMNALFQVLTIEDPDLRNSLEMVQTERESRQVLKDLVDLSAVNGKETLSEQQKRELAGVACTVAYKTAVDLACAEGRHPTSDELWDLTNLLLGIGVARKARSEAAGDLKADNLQAMGNRVVYGVNFPIVVNARGEEIATHRNRHQAAWNDASEAYKAGKDHEVKALEAQETISFAEMLKGAEGVSVRFVPKGEREVKDFKTGGTMAIVDPPGTLAFRSKEAKGKGGELDFFISVVGASGGKRFTGRFEQIMKPGGQPPKPRGFLLSDIASIDPRTMQGSWSNVEAAINAVPAPIRYVKDRSVDEKAYQGDQKVVWGAIKRVMLFAFSPKGETHALKQESDVHSKEFAKGAKGRTVLFQNDKQRSHFAVTRHEDSSLTFEVPERLVLFFGKLDGSYTMETIPGPMNGVFASILKILTGEKGGEQKQTDTVAEAETQVVATEAVAEPKAKKTSAKDKGKKAAEASA